MAKDIDSILFDITPEIEKLARECEQNNAIDKELYTKYEVKRGLRDLNGKGVLAGLTNVSDVCATKIVNGESVPCEGNLYYRGYNITIVSACQGAYATIISQIREIGSGILTS